MVRLVTFVVLLASASAASAQEQTDRAQRARASNEAHSPERSSQNALERSRFFIQIMPAVGLPTQSSYDRRLADRGYTPRELFSGLDLSAQYRVLSSLWVGGKTSVRFRSFGVVDGAAASASGQDVMGVMSARGVFGGLLDYWLEVAAGVGAAWTTLRETYDFALAPRLQGALGVGINLLGNWRIVGRVCFDWHPLYNVNTLGDDTNLGGPGVGLGVEWRR